MLVVIFEGQLLNLKFCSICVSTLSSEGIEVCPLAIWHLAKGLIDPSFNFDFIAIHFKILNIIMNSQLITILITFIEIQKPPS